MRTPLWISQPLPMVVWPSSETPGWTTVSGPTSTCGSTYVVAGSSIVTPAAISAWFFVCLTIRLTAASSRRLLIPRISSASVTVNVSTPSPRFR